MPLLNFYSAPVPPYPPISRLRLILLMWTRRLAPIMKRPIVRSSARENHLHW